MTNNVIGMRVVYECNYNVYFK